MTSSRATTSLLLLAWLSVGAAAPVRPPEEVKIVLSTELDRTAIWVGDIFHYTVKAVHGPGIEIVSENLRKETLNLAPFEVRHIAVRQGPFGADKRVTEITLELTSYESGQAELEIPSFPIYYFSRAPGARVGSESAAESVAVPVRKIGLGSTLARDTLRPRDNRELWQVTRSRWMIPFALGLAGMLWVASQLVRLLWGGSQGANPVKKRLNPRARQRLMRDFLERAQTIGRDAPGDQRHYCAEVSHLLRSYLANSLEIAAQSLTPQEIESVLREHGQNGLSAPVRTILERCDQVLYSPTDAELDQGIRDELQDELGKLAEIARH